MKKSLIITLPFCCIFLTSTAQKGKNEIGIGGEIAIPAGKDFAESFKTGYGGWIKFKFGIGKAADQVTFTSGYTSFSAKGSGSLFSANIGIVPLLLGYKHTIAGGLYIEPQAGYGSYHAKYTESNQSVSGSEGAFTYAIGTGYEVSGVDFGLRFQNATIEGISYGNVAFRIGYNIALKGK